jgi:hypothetical protein
MRKRNKFSPDQVPTLVGWRVLSSFAFGSAPFAVASVGAELCSLVLQVPAQNLNARPPFIGRSGYPFCGCGQPFRFIGQIQNPGPRAKQRPHIACQLDLPEPFADQPHLAFRPDFALPDIQPFTRR